MAWHITEPAEYFLSLLTLSQREKERYAMLKTDERRLEFLVPRYLFRILTGIEPDWQYDDSGRPKPFGGVNFSVSHCKGYAAVVVNSGQHVGVDVELISGRAAKISQKFLGSAEMPLATNDVRTTLLWSAKETMFKMCVKQGIEFKSQLLVQEIPEGLAGIMPCTIKKSEIKVSTGLEFRIFDKNILVWGVINESI